ncbi:MAG: DUF72 domain-containing protein [Bacteroidota bacterium]|nr:DUF72 domain-containing protein [Bacteroidota bacterium]
MKTSIGCSGIYFPEWKNKFYPEGLSKNIWFEYYCEHFNTLESNITFYRFPKFEFLQNCYKKSPSKFLFSVKAPRLLTHYKKFSGSERLLLDFYKSIHYGLKEKLDCVLFQMPSQLVYDENKLSQIIKSLDTLFLYVIEFRHESWWNEKVYNELGKNKISFCSVSHPKLPDEVIKNNSVMYFRFHGVPKLYVSEYKKNYLKQIAD